MRTVSTIFRGAIGLIVLLMTLPQFCFGDWRDLSAKELNDLLNSGQKLFLLNPLSDIEFNEGHIPASVNVPLHTIMRSDKMPEDRDTLIVTYCLSQK